MWQKVSDISNFYSSKVKVDVYIVFGHMTCACIALTPPLGGATGAGRICPAG